MTDTEVTLKCNDCGHTWTLPIKDDGGPGGRFGRDLKPSGKPRGRGGTGERIYPEDKFTDTLSGGMFDPSKSDELGSLPVDILNDVFGEDAKRAFEEMQNNYNKEDEKKYFKNGLEFVARMTLKAGARRLLEYLIPPEEIGMTGIRPEHIGGLPAGKEKYYDVGKSVGTYGKLFAGSELGFHKRVQHYPMVPKIERGPGHFILGFDRSGSNSAAVKDGFNFSGGRFLSAVQFGLAILMEAKKRRDYITLVVTPCSADGLLLRSADEIICGRKEHGNKRCNGQLKMKGSGQSLTWTCSTKGCSGAPAAAILFRKSRDYSAIQDMLYKMGYEGPAEELDMAFKLMSKVARERIRNIDENISFFCGDMDQPGIISASVPEIKELTNLANLFVFHVNATSSKEVFMNNGAKFYDNDPNADELYVRACREIGKSGSIFRRQ